MFNGGLYTGEPFKEGAPYANVPVVHDAGYMIHYNLRSGNPPPGAIEQYPGSIRPGNNYQKMIGVSQKQGVYSHLYCTQKSENNCNIFT